VVRLHYASAIIKFFCLTPRLFLVKFSLTSDSLPHLSLTGAPYPVFFAIRVDPFGCLLWISPHHQVHTHGRWGNVAQSPRIVCHLSGDLDMAASPSSDPGSILGLFWLRWTKRFPGHPAEGAMPAPTVRPPYISLEPGRGWVGTSRENFNGQPQEKGTGKDFRALVKRGAFRL